MIDHENKRIYWDYTSRSIWQACKEKERLVIRDGWVLQTNAPPLSAGHAFHAAIAAYYDGKAGGFYDSERRWHLHPSPLTPTGLLMQAKTAFLRDLQYEGNTLPVTLESEERRSLERMLALVEAYIERWWDEPYENILREDGSPMTELPFQIPLAQYDGYDIVYVGTIDRLMRNTRTSRPCDFETKTTTRSLKQYIMQVKPNHQITGYVKYSKTILPELFECVWDCTFISSRKPDMEKAMKERFWMYGIDIKEDFRRQTTSRTATDIADFTCDLEEDALDYAKWLLSGQQRWPRSDTACHTYGGCQFRNVQTGARCCMNLTPAEERDYLSTWFTQKKWNPLTRRREEMED